MIGLRRLTKIILTTRQHSNFYKNLGMNQVYFKHNVEDQADKMIISFRLQKQISDTKKLDKNFNFVRSLNETISTTLSRIKCNVEKEIKSKSKKKGKKDTQADGSEESNQEISVRFLFDNNEVHEKTYADLLNSFETSEESFKLLIEEDVYRINFNKPWIFRVHH